MATEFVKLADVKVKKAFVEEVEKLQAEIDAAMGDKSIGLVSFLEDALPELVIEIDNYRVKEMSVNGGIPSMNDKGRSYINGDSLYNAEQRIEKAGKMSDDVRARLDKDREFGKIGELQIKVEL